MTPRAVIPIHPTAEERLLYHRTVQIRGEIVQESAKRVIMQMLYLNSLDPVGVIRLEIDSPGGTVDEGLAMYDVVRYLKQMRPRVVQTHVAGRAEGMAAWIAAAGTKGQRTAAGSTVFRLMSCHAAAPTPPGKAARSEDLDRADDMLAAILFAHTAQPKAACLAAMRLDRTFTAAEAVAWGLVDAIV